MEDFIVTCNNHTGQITSVSLYGNELLCGALSSELWVNGIPLELRQLKFSQSNERLDVLKGERFINHMTGWSLVLTRSMGGRQNLKYNCYGINYWLRRENADLTCPSPGPGAPVLESPLWIDILSLLNLNWKFWGEDTRMMFASTHSNGPIDEYAHVGYENDTPSNCKHYMKNIRRRIYPGVMAIHGGVYYNVKTGEWIAITCRDAHVGYILNIENAGEGISYDFTLHSKFNIGEQLRLPEIKIYYGKTHDEMMNWIASYTTHYYQEPPEWFWKTAWQEGLAWTNEPTWAEQADKWIADLDKKICSGIKYSLVTNRPIQCGTLPIGYEPDPNHGTKEDFVKMCQRISSRGVPFLIWMSHSGLMPGALEVDDDWFVRGIDGRLCASWGDENIGMYTVNPGHPGYIEYTKKWIHFYIKECGAKGIFLDCAGWAFTCDFKKRDFMRFPGDVNIMGAKFIKEIYAYIKECDPDAILLGEGTTLDAPINVFSIHANPLRAIDCMGPRDFFLRLNEYSNKKFAIDQASNMCPASGMCVISPKEQHNAHNRYITKLLADKGGRDAFEYVNGDVSVLDDILFIPLSESDDGITVVLPDKYKHVGKLTEEIRGDIFTLSSSGTFDNVKFGFYKMS